MVFCLVTQGRPRELLSIKQSTHLSPPEVLRITEKKDEPDMQTQLKEISFLYLKDAYFHYLVKGSQLTRLL